MTVRPSLLVGVVRKGVWWVGGAMHGVVITRGCAACQVLSRWPGGGEGGQETLWQAVLSGRWVIVGFITVCLSLEAKSVGVSCGVDAVMCCMWCVLG